jgi:hypothetical protein
VVAGLVLLAFVVLVGAAAAAPSPQTTHWRLRGFCSEARAAPGEMSARVLPIVRMVALVFMSALLALSAVAGCDRLRQGDPQRVKRRRRAGCVLVKPSSKGRVKAGKRGPGDN